MSIGLRDVLVWVLVAATGSPALPGWAEAAGATEHETHDSVARAPEVLRWDAGAFSFSVTATPGRDYDAELRFASPLPSGDPVLDTVVLRWYRARQAAVPGDIPGAGVLLVHTLHPDMPVATFLARGLRQRGVDAFVIELPGYASRVGAERRFTGATTLIRGAQAVTDCRRAFDVIRSVLSAARGVNHGGAGPTVAIQGTSLGSFVAASAAALDGCFSQTFLYLSGGDGVDILERGTKDAFHVRRALAHYGYTGDKLRALFEPVEPLRLAPRLDAQTTWMFNARDDLVVPAENARRLADAIGLDDEHLVWMPGNHYTSFLLLPGVLDRIAKELALAGAASD
ncbi:MAG: hypothetical protein AAFX76_00990 [Planctomycetota bacterium]